MTLTGSARAYVAAHQRYARVVRLLGPRAGDARQARAELLRAHRSLVRAVRELPVERNLFGEVAA